MILQGRMFVSPPKLLSIHHLVGGFQLEVYMYYVVPQLGRLTIPNSKIFHGSGPHFSEQNMFKGESLFDLFWDRYFLNHVQCCEPPCWSFTLELEHQSLDWALYMKTVA